MQNFLLVFLFSIFEFFCKFFPKINLAFWCCLINLPVVWSQRLEASGFPFSALVFKIVQPVNTITCCWHWWCSLFLLSNSNNRNYWGALTLSNFEVRFAKQNLLFSSDVWQHYVQTKTISTTLLWTKTCLEECLKKNVFLYGKSQVYRSVLRNDGLDLSWKFSSDFPVLQTSITYNNSSKDSVYNGMHVLLKKLALIYQKKTSN